MSANDSAIITDNAAHGGCVMRLVCARNLRITMKLTINKNGEARKMKHAWHLVDWDQPTSVIAEQMGLSEGYVSGRRRKYAPETIKRAYVKKAAMMDRAKDLDWSKTDRQLAKETGRSHGSIWRTRRKISLHNA
jgi:hypothetical protein